MPILTVGNGWRCELPVLGKNTAFAELSEKRVTKCTRETLRKQYGHDQIQVSCDAEYQDGEWRGQCCIHGEPLGYRIVSEGGRKR